MMARLLKNGLPVTMSVPLVVVLLMVVVSFGVSQVVLSRLVATQERQLTDLATAYLDGLEAALIEPVLRKDSWEVFDALDRARTVYAAVKPLATTVTDADGKVLASSDPRAAPIGSQLPFETAAIGIRVQETEQVAVVDRVLSVEGRVVGLIHSRLDISPLLAERGEVIWYLVLTNGVLTVILAALGWLAVRAMIAPMRILLEHISSAAGGAAEPIAPAVVARQAPEWRRLFQKFNTMAEGFAERETLLTRIADEERLASLGKLASSVAHEINNPLGGILNAVDTIKVHGDDPRVRLNAVALVDRGLRGIRDVVQTILTSYRTDREARDLTPADFEDLVVLIRPEIRRKQIRLTWANELPPTVPVNAYGMRQVVLNLLLNACRASPVGGALTFRAGTSGTALEIEVADEGPGLPSHVAEFLAAGEPSAGRLATSGLGLWVTKRTVRELGGSVIAGRSMHGGARFRVIIPIAAEVEREIERVA
jgi:signal transduction histidine kinase